MKEADKMGIFQQAKTEAETEVYKDALKRVENEVIKQEGEIDTSKGDGKENKENKD
jgi:hypothetical protein